MMDVRASLFFICSRWSLVWYLREVRERGESARRQPWAQRSSGNVPRDGRCERHAGDHDADADEHGPAEERVQRDECKRDLEEAAPSDLAVRAQVLKARRVGRLEVDDVAREATAALGRRKDEGCSKGRSQRTSSNKRDPRNAPFL